MRLRLRHVGWIFLLTPACSCGDEGNSSSGKTMLDFLPEPEAIYIGSEACGKCHESQYESWRVSHHAQAERLIDSKLDAAAFADRAAIAHGSLTSQVRVKNGVHEVVTPGTKTEPEAFAVQRAIGLEPLVQYLAEVRPGRLQVLSLSYDPHTDEWFDVFGNEDRRAEEWGHWTGRGMVWNAQCADCHNTNLVKGYDPDTDTYDTRFDERGVGCEACHGPGSTHAETHLGVYENLAADAYTMRPWKDDSAMIDTCAVCHARRAELREHYVAGEPMLSAFLPELPDYSPTWYPDGQVHDEDYVYSSFLMSRMYDKGVTCMDCHDPHGAGMLDEGNALCMRCHSMTQGEIAPIEPARHSNHDPMGEGGQCVNCHMPTTVYMQRDPRRDHGFTIPDPKLTLEHGVPNACNRCHDDQDATWAANKVEEWYGTSERINSKRSRVMARAREGVESAALELAQSLASEEHATWRAIFCGMLSPWSEVPAIQGLLIAALSDESALVRTYAARALEHAGDNAQSALITARSDATRSVRVTAALASAATLDTQSKAGKELLASFAQTADQPHGLAVQANFWLGRGDAERAIELLERAEAWDPHSAPIPRLLALAFDAVGRPADAAEAGQRACDLDPSDPDSWYALGLARGAANQIEQAAVAIERSLALRSNHSRGWYNLGLLRNSLKQADAAEYSIRQAIALEPSNPDFRFALASVQRDAGRLEAALQAAYETLEVEPRHGGARALVVELERGGVRR